MQIVLQVFLRVESFCRFGFFDCCKIIFGFDFCNDYYQRKHFECSEIHDFPFYEAAIPVMDTTSCTRYKYREYYEIFLVGCVEVFRPNKRFGVYSSAASSRLMFCIPLVRYLYCVSGFALLSNKCAFIGIFISTVLTLPSRP